MAFVLLLANVEDPDVDVCVVRETAASDESLSAVLFTNLLSQLDRVRSHELNFLQRHNMKIIQQQLQVSPEPRGTRMFCCSVNAGRQNNPSLFSPRV